MNIFVTSPDPIESARRLDLKRVVKMITESYQLMSTALFLNGLPHFYKPTHFRHPCTKWVAESATNYQWLLMHVDELCRIYTAAYGKTHLCQRRMRAAAQDGLHAMYAVKGGAQTPFVNCTTFDDEDVTVAYKKQLVVKWGSDKRAPKFYYGDDHRAEWENAYSAN